MENKDKPAFAIPESTTRGDEVRCTGLTKREYFAAMAMQGLMACSDKGSHPTLEIAANSAASIALMMADELLKQLDI